MCVELLVLCKQGRRKQMAARNVQELPKELIIRIFEWLGPSIEDLSAVSLVSKTFYPLSCDDALWLPLCAPAWSPAPGYISNKNRIKNK